MFPPLPPNSIHGQSLNSLLNISTSTTYKLRPFNQDFPEGTDQFIQKIINNKKPKEWPDIVTLNAKDKREAFLKKFKYTNLSIPITLGLVTQNKVGGFFSVQLPFKTPILDGRITASSTMITLPFSQPFC